MTSGRRTAAIVAAVVVGIILALWKLIPNDEGQILSVLGDIEEILSVSGVEAPLDAVSEARKLEPLFTTNARIELATPDQGRESMLGRSDIVQSAAGIRTRVSDVTVEFQDIVVTVAPSGNSAQVRLTAKVEYGADDELWVQSVQLDFVDEGEGWRISRAKGVNPPRN